MERIPVQSKKISSIAYDSKGEVLEVIFKNGNWYRHFQVPAHFWRECMLADSVGKYYFNNIRSTFPFENGVIEFPE